MYEIRGSTFRNPRTLPRLASRARPTRPASLACKNSFSAACYTECHGPTQGKDRQFAVLPTRICYTFASECTIETDTNFIRMLKEFVQRSVKRESLNVKGFGGKALGNPTFHLTRLTFQGFFRAPFQHPA